MCTTQIRQGRVRCSSVRRCAVSVILTASTNVLTYLLTYWRTIEPNAQRLSLVLASPDMHYNDYIFIIRGLGLPQLRNLLIQVEATNTRIL